MKVERKKRISGKFAAVAGVGIGVSAVVMFIAAAMLSCFLIERFSGAAPVIAGRSFLLERESGLLVVARSVGAEELAVGDEIVVRDPDGDLVCKVVSALDGSVVAARPDGSELVVVGRAERVTGRSAFLGTAVMFFGDRSWILYLLFCVALAGVVATSVAVGVRGRAAERALRAERIRADIRSEAKLEVERSVNIGTDEDEEVEHFDRI